jgi:hypothetical protein
VGKKLLIFCLGICSSLSYAQSLNHPFQRFSIPNSMDGCSYPASPVNFCDKEHMSAIESAVRGVAPNFDGKYILLSIDERKSYFQRSLAVIDSSTGIVYPVPIDFYSGKPDVQGAISKFGDLKFNLKSNEICLSGSIYAYRPEQDGRFCFHFDGEKFIGLNTPYTDT